MQAIELLQAARKLLAEKGITGGASARDERGEACGSHSDKAACFCSYGALARARLDNENLDSMELEMQADRLLNAAAAQITGRKCKGYIKANDNFVNSGHPEKVLEMFDLAIAGAA